jgi:hypothetical protein
MQAMHRYPHMKDACMHIHRNNNFVYIRDPFDTYIYATHTYIYAHVHIHINPCMYTGCENAACRNEGKFYWERTIGAVASNYGFMDNCFLPTANSTDCWYPTCKPLDTYADRNVPGWECICLPFSLTRFLSLSHFLSHSLTHFLSLSLTSSLSHSLTSFFLVLSLSPPVLLSPSHTFFLSFSSYVGIGSFYMLNTYT